jgi:thymidylate synthase
MKVIHVRNVHQALPEACHQLLNSGVARVSRNGPVLKLSEPLTVQLDCPRERVLFWPQRDANPFFHLFEALWMLGGRDDVGYLAQFNKRMADFSDDGLTFNGAYGRRWRSHFGIDQIVKVATALRVNPDSRREVVSMWDARRDLGLQSRDIPCNLQAIFQRRDTGELDMVVTNRSNDVIWGMLGANAVHFSMLQELMAAMIGCEVGSSWQVSMNAHTYVNTHLGLVKELANWAPMPPQVHECPYSLGQVRTQDLVSIDVDEWMAQLGLFLDGDTQPGHYTDPFFTQTALPLLRAWRAHKNKWPQVALEEVDAVTADDWRTAAALWLFKRMK